MRLFVVEDNTTMRQGLQQVLQNLGFTVSAFERAETALAQLSRRQPDIVVCDYKLPGMDGLALLEQVRASASRPEVVLITAFGSIDLAVQAMQRGAADFITKPFSPDEIGVKLERLRQRIAERRELDRLSAENQYLRNQVEGEFNYGDIIGSAPAMQEVYRTLAKVAPTDASVIVYGESGTGKELIGRALHKNSPRRDQPFIRVNCGALAEGVLESELFGHEKGAFTGALRRKPGRFELAHRGTIFLDEVGDVVAGTQVKLLRVLQEKEFERVGGEQTVRVDVRVIAATNRNLKEEVATGRFREDLYYRLHIVPITLPPLRQRAEDVPALAEHFLKRFSRELGKPGLALDESALAALRDYHWPGNVRELENVLERAAVLCEGSPIALADLPPLVKDRRALFSLPDENPDLNATLATVEKTLLERAMARAHGVKAEAARQLGVKTTTLLYKLAKYGME